MNIVSPDAIIETPINREEILKHLERCGRTCYKSEDKITEDSAAQFVRAIVKSGHESVLEHQSITVRFICDRGVSHELVRHRLASYSQESTRYCNYKDKDIEFIIPLEIYYNDEVYKEWHYMCERAEISYKWMLERGVKPQTARAVLPTCLKTEVVMTANLREWRHFFKLRAFGKAGKPHPDMRVLAYGLWVQMRDALPEVFDDLEDTDAEL